MKIHYIKTNGGVFGLMESFFFENANEEAVTAYGMRYKQMIFGGVKK